MNTDFFHRSPGEWWDLIKQALWSFFAPHAYSALYAQNQYLRQNMDEWEEECRCDLIDVENELRRVRAELQQVRDENRELQARLEALTTK